MLRQDLSAYVLLGDPATRLPIGGPQHAARASVPQVSAPATAEPVELPIDIDELEEAIGKVMVGDESIKRIAQEYGLEKHQLRELAERFREAGRAALGVSD
jgi:hypothetical protein